MDKERLFRFIDKKYASKREMYTALPLGMNPVIYPPQYGKDARPGASMALLSTLFALISLPLFYALLLKLLGALPTA